jgi:hypothetical protein
MHDGTQAQIQQMNDLPTCVSPISLSGHILISKMRVLFSEFVEFFPAVSALNLRSCRIVELVKGPPCRFECNITVVFRSHVLFRSTVNSCMGSYQSGLV